MIRTALLLSLLLPTVAQAQEAQPPDIPPGEDQIEYLERNERAPYNGMILDMDTSIRWTNRLRWWPEYHQLRMDEVTERHAAQMASLRAQMEIMRSHDQERIDGLRLDLQTQATQYAEEINGLRSPPFWEKAWFGFTMGVILVSAAVGVGALIAVQ